MAWVGDQDGVLVNSHPLFREPIRTWSNFVDDLTWRTLLLLYLLASKHTQAFTQCTFAQAFKKTTEAGCQRGTNTYQSWPSSQLNDTMQVHKYTKKHKRGETRLIYKFIRVHVHKKSIIDDIAHIINISTCHN